MSIEEGDTMGVADAADTAAAAAVEAVAVCLIEGMLMTAEDLLSPVLDYSILAPAPDPALDLDPDLVPVPVPVPVPVSRPQSVHGSRTVS